MKHTLVLLASLAAIVSSGLVSLNIHRAEVQRQLTVDAHQAAAQLRQVAQEQLAAHQNAQRLQKLETSCSNGLQAYALLTPAQRDHVVKPDCSL